MKQGYFLLTSYIGRLVLLYGLAVILALGALLYFRDNIAHLQINSFAKPLVNREIGAFKSLFKEDGLSALIDRLEEHQNSQDQGFRYALIDRGKLISGNMNLFAPERVVISPGPLSPVPPMPTEAVPPPEDLGPDYSVIQKVRPFREDLREREIHILREKSLEKSLKKWPETREKKNRHIEDPLLTLPDIENERQWEWYTEGEDDPEMMFDFIQHDNLLQENFQLIESLSLDPGLILIAAFDTRAMENPGIFLNRLLIGLCLLIVAGFITTMIIGWKIHHRLTGINQTAADILLHNDLSRRIPEGRGRSEFDQLSHNLNQMLGGIEQKLDDMRHLSNNIAHDLRTPLTLLRHRLEKLGPTPGDKEQALQQMDRILDSFNAILRISNLESGAVPLDRENIELHGMLQDICDLYLPLAQKRRQTLQHHQDNYLIYGDRNLLFQVFANLIDNAVKYTPDGGKIILSAERKNHCLEIYIEDSGPGIPEAAQQKMLTRFARLDSSRTTEGNGLGLSLVKAIIDAHQGEINLSNRESGLRVTLRFPVRGGGGLA
ncbi:HAMP domain-containing sensor histidine kinase [Paremcibacter congregatus]|uniref:sensor histidine kinase n=1 Tax=Paremcibacter congregatus TaxID=2043170 RepID=UPI0030EB65B6